MVADAAISRLDAFGVEEGYEDASGKWRQAPPETCRAIADAMGHPDAEPSVLVNATGHAQRLSGPAESHSRRRRRSADRRRAATESNQVESRVVA